MKKNRYPNLVIPIKWINEGHDSDWDSVPNYRDCNILNPWEQGIIHDIYKEKHETISRYRRQRQREKVSHERERMKKNLERVRQPKRTPVPHKYVIAKIGKKWFNLGAFTVEGIEKVVEEAKQLKGATQVVTSSNKNEADRRNREKTLRQLETVVEAPFSRTDKLTKEQFIKRTYRR